jgi:hypothetical protein
MAENYLQHAEHYFRIMAAAQAQMQQYQPVAPNTGVQPRLPTGSEEQPYIAPTTTPGPQPSSSGPAFSLTDNNSEEEEDDDEEVDGQE